MALKDITNIKKKIPERNVKDVNVKDKRFSKQKSIFTDRIESVDTPPPFCKDEFEIQKVKVDVFALPDSDMEITDNEVTPIGRKITIDKLDSLRRVERLCSLRKGTGLVTRMKENFEKNCLKDEDEEVERSERNIKAIITSSIPTITSTITSSTSTIPSSISTIPCSIPAVPCSIPAVPCSIPAVPCSIPAVPSSIPAVPSSIPTLQEDLDSESNKENINFNSNDSICMNGKSLWVKVEKEKLDQTSSDSEFWI
jgi:hypothetical protein